MSCRFRTRKCHAVASCPVRSKLDITDAYEQIRIEPSDVHETAFATIDGTFLGTVLQQGHYNEPSTCQRLMSTILRPYIGRFVYVYLDDIFIFSRTLEDHEEHLRLVFSALRENKLYLSAKKVDLYPPSMGCLGHVIDKAGLHADSDKLVAVREWRRPRSAHDIQRLL